MKLRNTVILFIVIIFFVKLSFSQSLIPYNNQELFLSGVNLAWVSFANDIGPQETAYNQFAAAMLAVHDSGGNAMRFWMHTDGANSPAFNDAGFVISPGEGTIEDLKTILDLAWQREVGMKLCLWSFDMLVRAKDSVIVNRNRKMLLDTSYTMAYIRNSLIPMVEELKGHPGIITWEIFNEPEGMSNEFGWTRTFHVPMSAIQRFINLCAGAIHRTDPFALVTSGAWSFEALTDVPSLLKEGTDTSQLTSDKKEEIESIFEKKYGWYMSAEEIIEHVNRVSQLPNMNYYSDDRLRGAGGDPDGILDFYSVHYYYSLGERNSPFTHPASFWGLNKPIVVGEFAMSDNPPGVPRAEMFKILFQGGYAGALPWSWSDAPHEFMLSAIKYMWSNYKEVVDVNGISGEWPGITIISPEDNHQFPENGDITIEVEATDNDGQVTLVEFFVSDTVKIGEKTSSPYIFTWENVSAGDYFITAVVTDDMGNKRTSARVPVRVGVPTHTKLEAEDAVRTPASGGGISMLTNAEASGGRYIEFRTQLGMLTWTLANVPSAGNYEIKFGARLSFDRPKNQYINVNGERVTELVFDHTVNTWFETPLMVDLVQGSNTIDFELSWGWMDVDYLAVPNELVVTVEETPVVPLEYLLEQNYPNPFNPVTSMQYAISSRQFVKLIIYDLLGREVVNLVNEEKQPGIYNIKFDASGFASGAYFYKLTAGDFVSVKKMLLLK